MQFEFRYYVLKNSDLTETERATIESIGAQVSYRRAERGASPFCQGLFIEENWPEFEPLKSALVARIEREKDEAYYAGEGDRL